MAQKHSKSCKDVLFGGLHEGRSQYGVKSPKTFTMWAWFGTLKQFQANITMVPEIT